MKYAVKTAFIGGFSLVVALFLLAAVTTVWSVGRVRTLEAQLAALDHAKHQGHLMLADIQQQYIHQLHTLLLRDRSHLDHYFQARTATAQRLALVADSCERIGIDEGVEEIRAIVGEMDSYFLREVVPGNAARQQDADLRFHDRLDGLIKRARGLVAELNARLGSRSAQARGELERVLFRTQLATLGTLSLAVVAALCVGLFLARVVIRPLASLHRAFGSVSAGRLETRVRARGPRELRELALGFNEMAAALVEMRETVAQNERMAVMGELAAGVAHELNNPLGVIKGYLKIVGRDQASASLRGDLDVIAEEVLKCQEIVQGLTELARPHRVRIEDADLVSLVQETVERMEATREGAAATVRCTVPPASAAVTMDALAMGRVVANLLNNALDAAGPEGTVEIEVISDEEHVTLSVADSGAGIAPEIRDGIFKPFRTTKETGVGLGLAITLAVVRSHGGRIDVGTGPLGGACFRVVLPRSRTGGDEDEGGPA